jgi:hypothetical protein
VYFSNPWGLFALLALPAIVVIHLYHRRFPPLVVAGAHLWTSETRQPMAGRKRQNLPVTASLLLELAAALLISLGLSQPQFGDATRTAHLVAVLDNSASMLGTPAGSGALSFRDAAVAELERRVAALPRGSVVTLILSGSRPTMLAGPALPWEEARTKLADWQPRQPRHAFEPAWDLGLQLVETTGELLFLTDHLPPERETPDKLETVSVGRPLDNVSIGAARWTFDPATGRGRVFLRLRNQARRPAEFDVRGRAQGKDLFRRHVTLSEEGASSFEAEIPGGVGVLAVELLADGDGLEIDNRAELIEPSVRTVSYAITLPAEGEAARLLRKALDVLPDIQPADSSSANLVFAPGDVLPESDPKKWWVGLGPLSRDEAAIESARDLAGPFLLDKRHPLLEGIVLEGVVWGGVQPVALDVTPLVSSGRSILLARLAGTRTVGYLVNIDLARSNLGESPDWPILLANLIGLRRESLPGLLRSNYRLGEGVRFRLFEGEIDPAGGTGVPLTLEHAGQSKEIARASLVELSPPDETGIYEIKSGNDLAGRFAVHFQDADESDLRTLAPGRRAAKNAEGVSAISLDSSFSWLVLLGLALIIATILADWFVLRPAGSKQ